ncbi:hypothetical protein DVA86_25010 [Streptomyces armeniacus]|uniref:Lipoprotein n=1 Tax=Streptomyces armeniacus TaxID=83291 RepID=A0A345XUV9_9ACTN|nr:hypothetical protein [Streptomyces armeniacus]AXK35425.1 hypothetical protein DVA86_25010 [Streptomyces armeniacus]
MVAGRHGRRGAAAAAAAGVGAALVCTVVVTGCATTGAATDGPDGAGDADNAADSATADGKPERDPLAAVRGAADALERAGTSRTRTSVRMASGGTRVTIRGTGGFDYGRRTGRLEVSRPQEPSGAPTGKPITQLITPGALYMKNRGAGVPADKWVRVDTTTLPDGNLVTSGATDPLTAAELLRGARELSYVGTERMDGAVVRHYSGVTDLGAAARAATGAAREQLAAAARGFAEDTVSFDAFLDGQARLRKVQHRFTFGAAGDGNGGGGSGHGSDTTVTSTTGMFGFGAPVDVAMPAPEDIYTGKIAAP